MSNQDTYVKLPRSTQIPTAELTFHVLYAKSASQKEPGDGCGLLCDIARVDGLRLLLGAGCDAET